MNHYSPDPADVASDDPDSLDRARDSLFLTATFRIEGTPDSRTVRIRNLSPGGLMAEYPGAFAQGTRVELAVRGFGWISGQVAWSAAGRIGVAFDRLIDPLLARKPVGGGDRTPSFVKPILRRGNPR